MKRSPLQTLGCAVVGTGAACAAWGIGVERRWYAVRRQTLPVLRVSDSRRLRVLLFSDLHLAPGQTHRTRFLIGAAAAWHPDMVISAGDNLESPHAIDQVIAAHTRIAEETGAKCIAVLGAHDRYGPRPANPFQYFAGPSSGPHGVILDTDRLVTGLKTAGWNVLINSSTTIDTPAGRVNLTGLDDPHIGRGDVSVIGSSMSDPETVLNMGVVHAPYLEPLRRFASAGADIAVAGHTHGGQVAVPGYGALVTNCDLPPRQAKGTSSIAGMPIHVTAGLGHSVYAPIRFACRPELSVLDLVRVSAAPPRW